MAALSGDPAKSGTFTVRLKMPAGYRIAAHQHPHVERVTVITGEIFFGSGDTLEAKSANRLGAGGFVDLPANSNHYVFVKIPTVVQISGEGPFGIKYVKPTDDPSQKKN